jgi:hypothetical protein
MNGTEEEYSKMRESFEHIREFSFGIHVPEFTESPRNYDNNRTEGQISKGKRIYSIKDAECNFHGMYMVDSRDQSSFYDHETPLIRDIQGIEPKHESNSAKTQN